MIRLRMTCGACPEQYDAYVDDTDTKVGYLRLRHGSFTVDFPDCGGETIYEASPRGDGQFEDDERHHYLSYAVDAIERRIKFGPAEKLRETPDVEYEIEGTPQTAIFYGRP